MYNHAGRFVDDHELVVLVDNVEWDVFRLNGVVVARTVHHQRHHVERPYLVVALHRAVVHVDEARFGRFLYPVAAAVLQVLEEEFVHAHGYLALVGREAKVLIELYVLVAVVGFQSVQFLFRCQQFVVHGLIPPVMVRSAF